MRTRLTRSPVLTAVAALALLGMALLPAASAAPVAAGPGLPSSWKAEMSQAALTQYYVGHPDQAPAALRNLLTAAQRRRAASTQASPAIAAAGPMASSIFNADTTGLPQVEESVTRCASRPAVEMEGTNDDRGILDPQGNFGGWHLSTNGGRSLANEGRLPSTLFPSGRLVPSGGDPAAASDGSCHLYLANLAITATATTFDSGVIVDRSTPDTLAGCPGGTDPTCWPTRKVIDSTTDVNLLLDKPWMTVGRSGGQTVVWVTYTEFFFDPNTFTGGSRIMAVRCTESLSSCTAPQTISADTDVNTQFSYVTVGPDGRTYVTWINLVTTNGGQSEAFQIKLRVAEPGSTSFGPIQMVTTELQPIPFGGVLNSDSFRIATLPKSDVKMVGGRPRVYVVWESCAARPLGFICEDSQVKMAFSDSFGAGWSDVKTLSRGGDNYFVTISADPGDPSLAVAWWTSRFDPFDNRQDLELATVAADGTVSRLHRLTSVSNEPDADPLLNAFFIGDYIQVTARDGQALVGFNANYRRETVALDTGLPVPQEDNYLVAAKL